MKKAWVNGFDWRLSIATVKNDDPLSDLSGYTLYLVVIDGNGLLLEHCQTGTIDLTSLCRFIPLKVAAILK